jgi:hypothetical protein
MYKQDVTLKVLMVTSMKKTAYSSISNELQGAIVSQKDAVFINKIV